MESDLTLQIAIVTTALMLVLGSSMLFATRNWMALLEDYVENPQRLLVPGLAMTVVGLLIIFNHNIWEKSWVVAITIMGWVILLKGLGCLLTPDIVNLHSRFSPAVIKMMMRVGGAFVVLVALKVLLIITGQT